MLDASDGVIVDGGCGMHALAWSVVQVSCGLGSFVGLVVEFRVGSSLAVGP